MHVLTTFSMSECRPGLHTRLLDRAFILEIPGCLPWRLIKIFFRSVGGTTILLDHKMHPANVVNSKRLVQWGCNSSVGETGQPSEMKWCIVDISGSFCIHLAISVAIMGASFNYSTINTNSAGTVVFTGVSGRGR